MSLTVIPVRIALVLLLVIPEFLILIITVSLNFCADSISIKFLMKSLGYLFQCQLLIFGIYVNEGIRN